MLFGNVLSTLLGAARQLVLARFFTPAEFGVWNLLNLILSYANYADIGTNTGTLYRSSILIGEGNVVESVRVREKAFFFTLVFSVFLCVLFLVASVLSDQHRTVLFFAGLAIPIFLLLNFLHVEARVRDSFRLLGLATILGAAACLIFTVGATFNAETKRVEVMLAAWLLGSALMVIFLASQLRVRLVAEFDWRLIWRLIRIGLPLTMMPIVFTLFQSVDRWIIVGKVSPKEFGYYAFGTTIGMMLSMLPNTLGVVLSTRLIQRFGKTNDPKDSSAMVLISLWVSAYVMAFIAGGIVLTFPYFLAYFFPEYLLGRDAIITIVVANCLLFSMPITTSFLLANEKKRTLLAVLCVSIVIESLFVFTAQRIAGIEGAAYAVLVCDVLLAICMVVVSVSVLQHKFSWHVKRIAALFFPFVACTATALLLGDRSVAVVPSIDIFPFLQSCVLYMIFGTMLCALIAWVGGIANDMPTRRKVVQGD